MSQRQRVVNLYKTLLYMGRDYPTDYKIFRNKVHDAFMKNKNETDPRKIKIKIKQGEYYVKELEAFYMLKKYRVLKQRYYSDD